MMTHMLSDARYAVCGLLGTPGFSIGSDARRVRRGLLLDMALD